MEGRLSVFISESNGNSFTAGSSCACGGMVGLATFNGEGIIVEDSVSRLMSPFPPGALA
jgi:hypothetical protein